MHNEELRALAQDLYNIKTRRITTYNGTYYTNTTRWEDLPPIQQTAWIDAATYAYEYWQAHNA